MAPRVGLRFNFKDTLKFAHPENPRLVQDSRQYLLHKPSYNYFSVKVPEFLLPWQQGQSRVNFNDTVKLPNLENSLFGARFSAVSYISGVMAILC